MRMYSSDLVWPSGHVVRVTVAVAGVTAVVGATAGVGVTAVVGATAGVGATVGGHAPGVASLHAALAMHLFAYVVPLAHTGM